MKKSVRISLQLWKKTCRCVEIQNRTCLVHEFKHDCTTVLSTTPIGNHASTYAHTKKNVSQKWTTKICVDWHYHSHVLALFLFCALFFCKAHVVVEWECVLIYEYLPCLIHFLAFFFRTWLLLIIPSISSCSQLLHAGEFLWMYLLINSSLLQQLANNVSRYRFLLEKNVAYLTLSLLLK